MDDFVKVSERFLETLEEEEKFFIYNPHLSSQSERINYKQ